jgi:hypothetical protein
MAETNTAAARRRVVRLTVGAFVLYGLWALYANHEHGWPTALRAGLVQGVSSATTTLVITAGIEGLTHRLQRVRFGKALAVLLPPTLSSTVHFAVHTLNGTPEVWRTIAPSIVIGYVFALAYARAR